MYVIYYILHPNAMAMTSCIIVDDERYNRQILRQLIISSMGSRLQVLDSTSSVAEGVAAIKKHNPDIVFLDVEMPGQNGFCLFDHFDTIPFQVVFCTAYEHYAIEAIKVAAFDYLIKPVNLEDLSAVMDRYEKLKVLPRANQARINPLLNLSGSNSNTFNSIALPTRYGYQLEKIPNITYCRAQESYCKIYVRGEFGYLVSRSLKQMEEILPSDLFFRIHKSFLVNLNYVQTYKKTEGFIILQNGEELEVAHRRSEEFLKRLTRRL
jgi:two-component system, LytTR family, response regulator